LFATFRVNERDRFGKDSRVETDLRPGSTRPSVDLHTHSTASDGTISPSELVRRAHHIGIRILSLTDHDSTAGIEEATRAGVELGVDVIPGVELSATSSAGDLHLLGYFIDPESEALQVHLAGYREARDRRVIQMVTRLREHGVPITLEQVMIKAAGGSVSRAHIGRVLVDLGYAQSISDAFARWLGRNRPGFVPREPLGAADAVRVVLDAGGVPVLAHPLTLGVYRRQLPELKAAGLRGIEVYYGPYSDEQRAELLAAARQERLIATGGSDYHGPEHREGRELGAVMVPKSCVRKLRQAAAAAE
jgi:3',5'-nucleoside bisphosphate phosphatase